MSEIKSFRDLKVWQKAHELVLVVYKLTSSFPAEEKYALVSQIRRAVVSVASNIVEGFSRRTVKESLNFYNIADGSLEEVKCCTLGLIAKDTTQLNLPTSLTSLYLLISLYLL